MWKMGNAVLISDESHGIDIVEKMEKGCYDMLKKLNPPKLIACSSLGKGLGIQAGAVLGSKEDIEMLRNTSFYGGASPALPAFMGTLLDASAIYLERREKLMKNYVLFKSSLTSLLFSTTWKGTLLLSLRTLLWPKLWKKMVLSSPISTIRMPMDL
jgi:7-keto-8-aminopelargonate synthetase-like enzyme